MSDREWFRNDAWTAAIEAQFYAKLRRATKQRRAQYLCLQAYHLRRSAPEIALRLLDEYFAVPERFDDARAHTFRAHAQLALEDIDEAVKAYEAALDTEKKFPNSTTDARIDLPFLIASRRIQAKYPLAMTLLADPGILLFPYQRFKHHASLALILAERNELSAASSHAVAALR
jgi:tetratricopeptide (TPR) repeat protein